MSQNSLAPEAANALSFTQIVTDERREPSEIGRDGIVVQIEMMTPARAERILDRYNTLNRPISDRHIEWVRGIIERGEWEILDSGIGFDLEGVLVNGQHRLYAIALGEKAVPMIVTYGLALTARLKIDTGRFRTIGQTLTMQGEVSSNAVTAAVNLYIAYEKNRITLRGANRSNYHTTLRLTAQQVQQFLDTHPGMREAAGTVNAYLHPKKMLPPSVATWLYYEFSQIDQRAADTFFESVGNGIGLGEGDPRFTLRKRLLENASVGTLRKLETMVLAALTVRAWNGYRRGETLTRLLISKDSAFPIIAGRK